MRYDPDRHRRRSMRATWWDYAAHGTYFVTICVQRRLPLFGDVVGGRLRMFPPGDMVADYWERLPERLPGVIIDNYVVMPNHLHGIVIVPHPRQTGHGDRESSVEPLAGTIAGSLGRLIQGFKSLTTVEYVRGVRAHGWEAFDGRLWQRNYHDHIVRDSAEMSRIRAYIEHNPARWADDAENPVNIPKPHLS